MSREKKIRITSNGPYEVSPDIPLNQAIIEPNGAGVSESWGEGKTYPQRDTPYYLCRCGHSSNKPFCDGAHHGAPFHNDEVASITPYEKSAKCYRGDTVDLLDEESLCAVARFCDRGESAWVYAVASSVPGYETEAIRQACDCPSGRLTIRRKDGELVEPDLPQEISLVEDVAKDHRGPLWVKGGIPIEGQDGTRYEVRNRVTLCRCGQSENMPFCDASHLICDHMKGQDD